MNHVTQKLLLLLLAAFFAGAFYFPALAQEENEQAAASTQTAPAAKPADIQKKKTAAKKKIAKKKKKSLPEPASEYKFQSQDSPPAYTFDKKGDPIVKKKKAAAGSSKNTKKSAGSGMKRAAGQPLPKLNGSQPSGKDTQGNRAARYVCPMGEYESDKPGQCPKCGMTLVEKT